MSAFELIIAIDPGISHGVAYCLRQQHPLLPGMYTLRADYASTWRLCPEDRIQIIVERPTIYKGGDINPDTQLTLALTAGRLCERLEQWARANSPLCHDVKIRYVEPRTWKKSIDKKIHHARGPKYQHAEWAGATSDQKDAILLCEWYSGMSDTQREVLTKRVKV